MYEYIYAEIQSIQILRVLQVSRLDPWAHIRVKYIKCVCVRAYIHAYTHIHSNPCQK